MHAVSVYGEAEHGLNQKETASLSDQQGCEENVTTLSRNGSMRVCTEPESTVQSDVERFLKWDAGLPPRSTWGAHLKCLSLHPMPEPMNQSIALLTKLELA